MKVGVISDTHGLVRPEALTALSGCDHVLHAGDIGKPEVLPALERIAPLTAIRGNVDKGEWAASIPEQCEISLNGVRVFLIHDLKTLDIDPAVAGIALVISGHSHQPKQYVENGVLYLNPGSAGPRRFRLPVSVATLDLGKASPRPPYPLDATLITLDV